MKIIPKFDMSHADWLKYRQSFIGGSESAAVLGLNEYMSPVDVYLHKIAPEPVEIPTNDLMESGHDAELFMPQWYARQTGYDITPDDYIRIHGNYDFIGVNLDGVIVDIKHKTPGVLEIKSTNVHEIESWENKLPYRHALQVHHGMLVTGWTWGVVIVFVRETWQKLAFAVDYSKDVQNLLIEAYQNFWFEHVQKHIPPDPQTLEDVKNLFPQSEPEKIVVADDSDYDMIQKIQAFKGDIKVLEDEIAKLKMELQSKMQDGEVLQYNNKIIATWKTGKEKMVFDEIGFSKDNRELYQKYLKTKNGNRTFLDKKLK